MPEFDVETVSRTNKLDKVKQDILNRRQAVLDSYEQYMKYRDRGHDNVGLSQFKMKLGTLFLECKQMIHREINNERSKKGEEKEYTTLKEIDDDVKCNDAERVEKAFNYIEALLYQKHITQIDTRPTVDTTDVFEMNKKGYY